MMMIPFVLKLHDLLHITIFFVNKDLIDSALQVSLRSQDLKDDHD